MNFFFENLATELLSTFLLSSAVLTFTFVIVQKVFKSNVFKLGHVFALSILITAFVGLTSPNIQPKYDNMAVTPSPVVNHTKVEPSGDSLTSTTTVGDIDTSMHSENVRQQKDIAKLKSSK